MSMQALKHSVREELKTYTVTGFFPIFGWISRYNPKWAINDMVAGLTVGMVMVPYSLAYAKLANVPVEYGLYSAFFCQLLYPFVATSKDGSIGLTALCGQLVGSYQAASGLSAIDFLVSVAFISGFIELALVIFRVTMIVDLISIPIIFGFSTGAGLAIMAGQIPKLLGIPGINTTTDTPFVSFINTLKNLGNTRIDAAIGFSTIVFLYFWVMMSREIVRRGYTWGKTVEYAGNAIILILMTAITYPIQLANGFKYVTVVGDVPSGLPSPSVPVFGNTGAIMSAVFTSLLVNVIEHVAVTKLYARQKGYITNPRQEIMALGLMNIWGSFFKAIPIGASLSRSPVKAASGSSSPLTDFCTAFCILVTIYGLTGVFKSMPIACLSGIILFAVKGLLTDYKIVLKYWRFQKLDFFAWLIAAIVTPFSSIQYGIFASVGYGVAVMLIRMARPFVTSMAPTTGGNWRADKENQELARTGIAVFKLEESLIYPNAAYVADVLSKKIKEHTAHNEDPNRERLWCELPASANEGKEGKNGLHGQKPDLKGLVLDFSAVNHVDSTGVQALIDIQQDLSVWTNGKCPVVFANVHERLAYCIHEFHRSVAPKVASPTEVLESDGSYASMMEQHHQSEPHGCNLLFGSTEDAIAFIRS